MADEQPDFAPDAPVKPLEAAGPDFAPDAPTRSLVGKDFGWSQAITDIPTEIGNEFSAGMKQAKEGFLPEKGPEPQNLSEAVTQGVTGGLKAIPQAASGLLGAARAGLSIGVGPAKSVIGHGMANLEHLAGEYVVNPALRKLGVPEERLQHPDPSQMYETAKSDVETALSAARQGAPVRAPTGAPVKFSDPLNAGRIEWRHPPAKVKPFVADQPETDAFFEAANNNYRNMGGYGVEFDPKAINGLADNIVNGLTADGYRERKIPNVWSDVAELRQPLGPTHEIADIMSVRDALQKSRSIPGEGDAARKAIKHIDDYLANLTPNSPDVVNNAHFADRIAEEAAAARSNWRAGSQSEAIDEYLRRAETAASTHGNIGHQIQLQLKNLRNNKSEMKFWSDDQKAELDAAIKGTTVSKMMKQAGKFSPHGIVSTAGSIALGHAALPGLGAAAVPTVGFISKKIANFMAQGRAERLRNVVTGRSALGRETSVNVAAQRALNAPPPRPGLPSTVAAAALPKPHRLLMKMPQTEQSEQKNEPQPPATAGFARGGNVNTHSRREILPATGSSGKIKAEAALPKNHQLGMRVPKGGSSCGSCRFLKSPTECGNKGFVKWNGGRARLPAPKDQYCCDLYESRRKRADGGGVGEILAEDFGDRFFPGYVGRVRGEVSPLATPLYQKARGLLQDMIPADFASRWNPGLSMDLHKAEAKPKGYADGSTVEDTQEAPPRRLVMDMSDRADNQDLPDVGEPMMGLGAGPFSEGTKFGNRLFGTGGEERYQTWPEKLIRSGLSAAGDTLRGDYGYTAGLRREDVTDLPRPDGLTVSAEPSDPLMERTQDMAGLAGGAGFGGMGKEAVAQATRAPSLRQYWQPAAKAMSDSSTTGAPLAALEHAPTFYSGLEKAVEAAPLTKASGSQWLGTIGKGVKKEEMEYTGTQAFLEQNADKPLTKQQVLDHISKNKVELGEVHKNSAPEDKVQWQESGDKLVDQYEQFSITKGPRGFALSDEINGRTTHHETLQEAKDQAQKVSDAVLGSGAEGKPKFAQYQLPGGSNYREKLLTLPAQNKMKWERTPEGDLTAEGYTIKSEPRDGQPNYITYGRNGRRLSAHDSEEMAKSLVETSKSNAPNTDIFRSSHWDEPNVLVHRRTNERDVTGINGDTKPSLHMEENQSDLHQQGRKKGYQLSPSERARVDEIIAQGDKVGGVQNLPQDIQDEAKQLSQRLTNETVPNFPFKSNWHELAIKDAIREAAEKGFNRISWTPGEAQAARYDLSKTVDNIKIRDSNEAEGGKHVTVNAKSGVAGSGVVDKAGKILSGYDEFKNFVGKDLADVVGKDMAEHILKSQGETRLEGEGLKIGGKGMVGFYDKMIPAAFNKIGKPHGVKVEKGETSIAGGKPTQHADFDAYMKAQKESAPVHYMDIPESLKQQALKKGFSLFEDSSVGAPLAALEHKKHRATGGRINDNSAALKLAYQVKKERGHHEKFKSHG